MNKVKKLYVHNDFTLNGKTFNSIEALLSYARLHTPSIHSFLTKWFNDDDFINVKTSGSTGKPKNILLKKEYMVNSAKATGAFFDLQNRTKALLCLSTDFIAGKMMLVRALTLGWHLDSVAPDGNPLKGISQDYDFSAMVPLQVYNSLDKLSHIKKLIIGGGTVSKELAAKLQSISTEAYVTYGMTETYTHIAVQKLNNLSFRKGMTKDSKSEEKITSVENQLHDDVYFTLPNISISTDERGCLVIEAPKISDKQIVTNDLVELISDHTFKWLGRYDGMINSGGIKLIPEQIEEKLSTVIKERFFVAGIPDEALGERMIVVIESEIEDAVLLSEMKNLPTLDSYEVPKKVYFIPKFLETETKKIQRQKTLDLIFENR
ncbi:MAG: AMP-binding protein [Flavobacteriaceae bacterium]|nr:AMP-binding protein [Flavobacteriaceae bacterium]